VIDLSEMPGWILVVIPVFLFVAWILFRSKTSRADKKHQLSSEYFTGLNYLLNDEQGKALDIFVKLVESDWEIIDTHFALGKIFRKNGEIDKAIKIHQGLIARPSLPEKYRSQVLLELGYDYLGAGWFDRAEGLFKEVLIHDKSSEKALRNLILIYQQEKDWHKAIDIAVDLYKENLPGLSSEMGPMISQFYCELADLSRAKGDVNQSERYAKKALKYDAGSVRASMLLAEQAIEQDDYKQAIHYFEQIEKQDAEFIPVVLDQLIECYHRLDKPDTLLKYLDEIENRHNTIGLLEKHAMAVERYQGRDAVIEYLSGKLKNQPSLQGMHHLLAYKSDHAESDDADLMLDLKSALHMMRQDDNEFLCHHCGFQSNTLYWLCPSCQSWGEVKPALIESF
jgi:lipopolysaccharide biosynthesis regulator YciM